MAFYSLWSALLDHHVKIELFIIRRGLLPGANIVQPQNPIAAAPWLKPENLEDRPAFARFCDVGLRLVNQLQERRRFLLDIPHEPRRGIRFQPEFERVAEPEMDHAALVRVRDDFGGRKSRLWKAYDSRKSQQKNR